MNTIDQGSLLSCLAELPQLELKGMRLLRDQPQAVFGRCELPCEAIIDAVTEIVAYTERCAVAAQSLANLTPTPVLTISVGEFGL